MNLEEKYKALQIANYFIWLADKEKINDLTLMKLNKLVYIGYAWYYYFTEETLFDENVEAWQYGPVIPTIYHEFKGVGKKPISSFATFIVNHDKEELPVLSRPMIKDKKIARILSAVFDLYKKKSGTDLSEITHREDGAWEYTYKFRSEDNERPKFDMNDTNVTDRIKKGAELGLDKFVKL